MGILPDNPIESPAIPDIFAPPEFIFLPNEASLVKGIDWSDLVDIDPLFDKEGNPNPLEVQVAESLGSAEHKLIGDIWVAYMLIARMEPLTPIIYKAEQAKFRGGGLQLEKETYLFKEDMLARLKLFIEIHGQVRGTKLISHRDRVQQLLEVIEAHSSFWFHSQPEDYFSIPLDIDVPKGPIDREDIVNPLDPEKYFFIPPRFVGVELHLWKDKKVFTHVFMPMMFRERNPDSKDVYFKTTPLAQDGDLSKALLFLQFVIASECRKTGKYLKSLRITDEDLRNVNFNGFYIRHLLPSLNASTLFFKHASEELTREEINAGMYRLKFLIERSLDKKNWQGTLLTDYSYGRVKPSLAVKKPAKPTAKSRNEKARKVRVAAKMQLGLKSKQAKG